MRRFHLVFPSLVLPLLLFISCLQTRFCLAQSPNGHLSQFGAADQKGIDTIDLSTGEVYFDIPLFEKPGRGISLAAHATYDSAWRPTQTDIGADVVPWQSVLQNVIGLVSYAQEGTRCVTDYHFSYVDSHNIAHYFPAISISCPQNQSTFTGISSDGTGMTLNMSGWWTGQTSTATLTTADGAALQVPVAAYKPGGSVTDANGNYITANTTALIDTLGESITFTNYGGYNSSGTLAPETYTYQDSNGAAQTVTLNYESVPTSVAASAHLLQSIVLANGTSYQFTYNYQGSYTTGRVASVTLPTGGSIQYTYTGTFSTASTNYCLSTCSLTRTTSDGTWTYTWTVSDSSFGPPVTMTVVDPQGNATVYNSVGYAPPSSGWATTFLELSKAVYQGAAQGTPLILQQTCYNGFAPPCANEAAGQIPNYSAGTIYTDEYLSYNGGPANRKTTTYGYPLFVPTEVDEYDFGGTTPLRKTMTQYLTLNGGQTDKPTSVIIQDGQGNIKSQTTYAYDETALTSTSQYSPPNHASVGSARGNLTSIHDWINASNSWVQTSVQYDDTGNPLQSTDPKSNVTTYSYLDSWSNTSCQPSNGNTLAYRTKVTNALGQSTTRKFNSCSGTMALSTDPNQQSTSFSYDSMGRQVQTNYPDGGQVTSCFTDEGGSTCSKNSAPFQEVTIGKINASQNKSVTTYYDGYGRAIETALTSDPQGTVYTTITYDSDGRMRTVSNPYRSTSDSTYGITTIGYDGANRKISVTKPDGSASITAYCYGTTLVTDEAGHWRRSTKDGLDRRIEVDEPNSLTAKVNANGCPATGDPIWVTSYAYDTLDDLTGVVQGGSHQRTFAYDSLKRLTSSINPELNASGSPTTYSYDSDGNVVTKVDARGITTCFGTWAGSACNGSSGYDALNRLLAESYSDTTPSVAYAYDQGTCIGQTPCYNVGHRTSTVDAGGTKSVSYDTMGREWGELRTTNGVPKTTTYTYDLAGDLYTLTYPSGRMITYAYNSVGQQVSAEDIANSINYVTSALYAPQGAIAQMQAGPNLFETFIYNNRLQPCWLYATTNSALATSTSCTATDSTPGNILDLKYGFNLGAGDNGNAISITNNRDTTRSQSFTYDQVNRILSGQTSATTGSNCWGETYAYDQWANLQSIAINSSYSGCTQEGSWSATANQNNQLPSTIATYDASGNTLSDNFNIYTWNAESQMTSGAGVNYTYGGDGNRLEKSSGKIYWYGLGNEILNESDLSGNLTAEYVFFGGKRIAMRNVTTGTIYYYAEDKLASSRTLVQSGQTTVCYDADFYPFGGERDVVSTCSQNYKFESKERDTETGNDDFGARYYSNRLGRWLSADWSDAPAPVPYADMNNPQTLNLYAMVGDNPETAADLDGHCSGQCDDVTPAYRPNLLQRILNFLTGGGSKQDSSPGHPIDLPPSTGGSNGSPQASRPGPGQVVGASANESRLSRAVDWILKTRAAELSFESKMEQKWEKAKCYPNCGLVYNGGSPFDGIDALLSVPRMTLYRAVDATELKSIQTLGKFSPSPGGAETKYFYPTSEQAVKMGQRLYGDGNFAVVSGKFPVSVVEGPISVATEGNVFTVPIEVLSQGEVVIP